MAGTAFASDTNMLIEVLVKLNPSQEGEALQTLKTIRQELDNEDLGRSFYSRLKMVFSIKLIDSDNIKNDVFYYTTEFACKRD